MSAATTATRPLDHETARAVYDRIGRWQDTQAFYEDRFTTDLIRHSRFDEARSVVELGCGTGRFAARVLGEELPADATYLALDQSDTMIGLATERLARWAPRVTVRRTDGAVGPGMTGLADASVDRFASTYVLDLFSPDDIRGAFAEAHRVLSPGGRLCVVSATEGQTPVERLVTGVVKRVWALKPELVGGCRPVELVPYLAPDRWEIEHRFHGSAWGIASEVIVARPLSEP